MLLVRGAVEALEAALEAEAEAAAQLRSADKPPVFEHKKAIRYQNDDCVSNYR